MIDAFSRKLFVPGATLTANEKYFGQSTKEFYIPYRAADPSGGGVPTAHIWLMNVERILLPANVSVGVQWESFDKTSNEWVSNGNIQTDDNGFIGNPVGDLNVGLNRVRIFLFSETNETLSPEESGALAWILVVPMCDLE